MEKLNLIKIGGNIVENDAVLRQFIQAFSAMQGKKILIHGGGKIASQLAADLGITPQMVDGRRITDEETLKVVTMVYAGLTNKKVIALLQANHCDAIGLSGADANVIKTVKRPVKAIDYGFAGDMTSESINAKRIQNLLNIDLYPVFSAITHDGNGQLLNTNADTIAAALATGLAPFYDTSLIYCFEKKGVLKDISDDQSVIPHINASNYSELRQNGIISDGMIPKLDNAFDALSKGVKRVIIKHADDLLDANAGTVIS